MATYGALSHYVFDVGNWDTSRWVVFQGTSGHRQDDMTPTGLRL